ncbi:MAG: metal ABC transporter ATP-binding protein [Desertimonas sp.]
MNEPVVGLRDARFGYDGRVAAHADLTIDAGEVVALLGSNGSGKSTLVKGMLGLADRHGGEVAWFGQPLRTMRDRWRIGYVPQRELASSPIPATLEEIVRTGRVARTGLIARSRREDRTAIERALMAVGLSPLRRTPFRELSGGQQRRGLVARALAGQPAALVLDEPFAGVDRESQVMLADTFARLAGDHVTLIVVLHELGPLDGLITRAVCLAAGEIVYDGPPAQRPGPGHGDHDPHGGSDQQPDGVEPGRDGRPRLGLFVR